MKIRISDLKTLIREELLRDYLLEELETVGPEIDGRKTGNGENRGEVCVVCGRYAQPGKSMTRSKSGELVHRGDCQRVADTVQQSLPAHGRHPKDGSGENQGV